VARAPESMKSMRLYHMVERIHGDLRERGIADDAPLDVRDLTPFDQYHYRGTAAVDEAIAALGLDASSDVLDVGSGIGGPARYLAARAGCRVTALELQADLHETAAALTRRCGLDGRVSHVQGDILGGAPGAARFDALVSWLVFLHIADRPRLFAACRGALRDGGGLYVEDFSKRREPSPEQWAALDEKVRCTYLPTAAEYRAALEDAGFRDVAVDDLSADWTTFTAERLARFRERRARHEAVYGAEVAAGLEDFFATIAALYADGVLGGVRIVARAG
jgi:cyclopropane fatty-acyl-phospholipid synthase-like methyltransferase